jgi:hypothetical protein
VDDAVDLLRAAHATFGGGRQTAFVLLFFNKRDAGVRPWCNHYEATRKTGFLQVVRRFRAGLELTP